MTLKTILTIRKHLPTDTKAGSIETRYKMAKFLKATADEYEFYVKQYQTIMNECALRKDDGSIETDAERIALDPSKIDEYLARMKELDGTVIEAPGITFTINELAPMELSVEALLALDPIIVDK